MQAVRIRTRPSDFIGVAARFFSSAGSRALSLRVDAMSATTGGTHLSFGIHVKGGTNAGRKKVKRLKEWTCKCGRWHPGKDYSCTECGARRPTN